VSGRDIQFTTEDVTVCIADAVEWAMDLPADAVVDDVAFVFQGRDIARWGWRGTARLESGSLSPFVSYNSTVRHDATEVVVQRQRANLERVARAAVTAIKEFARARALSDRHAS
jgi:hypothetical protein